ncbi:MAG: hypothetical protein KAS75_01080 [Planctomycetes bacterium]|nr:hypothetical protein [Planctomycetota bacterium]
MATAKAVKLVKDNSIDLVWASVPYWSGMHLAYRTWKRTGVPYILDFRDVRRNQEISKLSAQDRRIIRLESKAIENAAGITYVAPKQIEALNSTHKKSKQMPSKLVYNWVKNFQSRQDSHSGFDNPTIIYGGSLYSGTRKIDGFFEALSKLKTHNKNNEHKVQFRHFGLDNEIGMIKSLSVKYGIDDIVFPSGLITSQKLAAYSHKSDILLLVVGHNTGNVEHANAIPAKLYDYFGAKRPILVLGPKDCEAGNIVQKTNRGIAVDDDDPIGIEKAIKLLLEGKTETGSVDLSDDAISEFSEKTVVTGFVSFIESICN